ncbi:MAG: type II secretion system protein [Planctomycetota bacterium]
MVRPRSFTLLELLIVIAVISVLAALLLTTLRDAVGGTEVAVTRAQLQQLETALSSYYSDQGAYPRLAPRPGASVTDADGYMDDCVALWRGLMNAPTRQAGGGANSPYLEWDRAQVGLYRGGPAGRVGGMPTLPDGTNQTDPLPAADASQLGLLPYQLAHLGPTAHLVLTDRWGNPIHYREWSSVREATKHAAVASPVTRDLSGTSRSLDRQSERAPLTQVADAPRRLSGYVLWSNGPNGINEFGHPDSDDIANWVVSR